MPRISISEQNVQAIDTALDIEGDATITLHGSGTGATTQWKPSPQDLIADQPNRIQEAAAGLNPTEFKGNRGSYEIRERICQGGMGVVDLAFDHRLERKVAIKRLLISGMTELEGLPRFAREAKAIAALNHRNIVTIYEMGEDEYGPYIVMEFIPGGNLLTLIEKQGRLGFNAALEVIRQIARGLGHAHQRNIVHRDVKPSNIILNEEGVPKLVDFGIAIMEANLRTTTAVAGTPVYMSPEQRDPKAEVTARADIYSLAKTLYQLLTGKYPTDVSMDSLPTQLVPVMEKAMQEQPAFRQTDIRQFLFELDNAERRYVLSNRVASKRMTCPECEAVNAQYARFCLRCGNKLTLDCPSCHTENRRDVQYCMTCGINFSRYQASQDSRRKVQELLETGDFYRARDEADLGAAIGFFEEDFEALRHVAIENQRQFDRLRVSARKFISKKQIESALECILKARAINPHHQRTRKVELMLKRETYRTKFDSIKDKAVRCLNRRQFEETITLARQLRLVKPNSKLAADLLSRAKKYQDHHRFVMNAARGHREAHQDQEALKLLDELILEFPHDEQVKHLRWTWSELARFERHEILHAREAIKKGRFRTALGTWEQVQAIDPEYPEAIRSIRILKRLMARKSRYWRTRIRWTFFFGLTPVIFGGVGWLFWFVFIR
ncbi:MAG: serine/threonine-protein kinase [Planctomycetota bacterium]|nr:serine/threonine-protein kinase [Planctomycetota bacterium]